MPQFISNFLNKIFFFYFHVAKFPYYLNYELFLSLKSKSTWVQSQLYYLILANSRKKHKTLKSYPKLRVGFFMSWSIFNGDAKIETSVRDKNFNKKSVLMSCLPSVIWHKIVWDIISLVTVSNPFSQQRKIIIWHF